MPSSISNSEASLGNRRGAIASAALLLILLVLAVGIELVCRYGIPRVSRIERRVQTEYQALVGISHDSQHSVRVAVLGNSLLGAGIQFDEARRELSPDINIKRLLVEDTNYFDWKYGLRRLFRQGARPDVVVIVLTARQLVSPRIRDDYFAYHLMDLGDLMSVASDVNASNTRMSDLAFSNLSAFGGIRAEARKLVAGTLMPDLPHLTSLMTVQSAPALDAAQVQMESQRRLLALKELIEQFHCRFILVIPPEGTKAAETMASVVQEVGTSTGISVLVPITPGSLPASLFADGFHLNEQGAKVFTPKFVASLRAEITHTAATTTVSVSRPTGARQKPTRNTGAKSNNDS